MGLTEKIQSLTTKANQKTGQQDSTLSEAVDTLIDGYDRIPEGYVKPTGTKTINITENGTTIENVTNYVTTQITANVVNQDYEDALVAFGVEENLSNSIESLTTYSNEVTGESDTTLSDAVRTLTDGYGGDYDNKILPSEYQRVSYIKLTGTQYIDTEYIANTTKTAICMKITPQSTSAIQGVCGSRTNRLAADVNSCNVFYMTNKTIRFDWAMGNANISKALALNSTWEFSCTRLIGDSIDVTSGPFLIGSVWDETAPFSSGFIGLIYYARIYEDMKIKYYLIPCYRKSDEEIGMYDLVNDVFYTNAGTGTFTKGVDIQ